MASAYAHDNEISRFDAYYFNAFMHGTQAAWKMRDAEMAALKRKLDYALESVVDVRASSVKAERERCANVVRHCDCPDGPKTFDVCCSCALSLILNPPQESDAADGTG